MNKHIIAAVFIIGASGVVRSWQSHHAITPVILGSYVLLLVLSIMDMFGGRFSQFAGAMALLAASYVLLTEFPWSTIIAVVQGKKV